MKRVEITVSKGLEGEVEAVLNGFELAYFRDEANWGGEGFYRYVLLAPGGVVEELVDRLGRALDTRRPGNGIAVYDVAAYVARYVEDAAGSGGVRGLEELTQPLRRFLRPDLELLAMVAVATVVALAGLLLDNPVVVIGAMLVSPLLGPVNAVVVNTSLGRAREAISAELSILTLMLTALSVSLAVAVAVGFFMPLRATGEVLLRTKPSAVDILVAILLGIAGGMALTRSMAETLVGVAVAASLLPPAAASGILAAMGMLKASLAAAVLMLINLAGLQAGGLVALALFKVQPRLYYERKRARVQRAVAFLTLLALLLILYFLTLWFG